MQRFWYPSPNFGPRKGQGKPELIVLHYTAMKTAIGALNVLCDPANEVSAHFVIAEDGVVYQLVGESHRAWHAGAGQWGEITDVNSNSIGIELCNDGFSPFSEPLMTSLEELLPQLMARWKITPDRVIGHSDLAPMRKIDPGKRFDWARLARQGYALAVTPDVPCAPEAFFTLAQLVGYHAPGSEPDLKNETAILNVFRLRHRPWGEGPLCEQDCAYMSGVVRALGLASDAAPA